MSLLDPRNQEQRDRQNRVMNFGAYDNFRRMSFKDDIIDLALIAVESINGLPYLEYEDPEEGKEPEPRIEPYDVLDFLACESIGIDDETEWTPELMENYNMVLSQLTHALGYLAGGEKSHQETAFESVQNEDNDRLAKTCVHINEQLNYRGIDDEEVATEYVLDAPVIYGEEEGEEIAVEAIKKLIRGGKKVLKSTKKKLRGAELALRKKLGRKLGKMKMKTGAKKKALKSKKLGKRMGLY